MVVMLLWQTYLDRVDPIVKVIHVPTVQQQIMQTIKDRRQLTASSHALNFAIYYAAIVTMQPEECRHEMKEEKREILNRYLRTIPHAMAHN